MMKSYKHIAEWIKNHSLHSARAYINWAPGQKTATLDGHFSVEELEETVHFMRTNKDKVE